MDMIVKENNMEYQTVAEYEKELKELLNTDYVGHPTANQLKMGVDTLKLLVTTLQERNNGKV